VLSIFALGLLLALPSAALAQAPAGPPAGAPAGGAPAAGAEGAAPGSQWLELEPPRDGYSYNPQNRRDPFISLLKPPTDTGGTKGKPQGIAGLIINEVALKGIVKDAVLGYIALLVGPRGETYFCKVGQRLYDGAIIAIDAATVTFRQEVTDPLAPVKIREIKKTLYPSEEARQ
jgi:hypothetical protein